MGLCHTGWVGVLGPGFTAKRPSWYPEENRDAADELFRARAHRERIVTRDRNGVEGGQRDGGTDSRDVVST